MNHSRKLLKRAIAITTAASFVTVGGNTALAAGSYREAETAAYDNFVAGTASLWNDYLENYPKIIRTTTRMMMSSGALSPNM